MQKPTYNISYNKNNPNQLLEMKKISFILIVLPLFCFACKKNVPIEKTSNDETQVEKRTITLGPADNNIRYFGRWDFSNSAQFLSYWGGAYFKVNFTGTTAKIKVGNNTNYYAKIDNGPWISYTNATGIINLTPNSLPSGTHTLTVAQGKDYSYVFNFQGLILDEDARTTAPAVGTDLIEYIGDSITAGYTDPQANVSGYAWVCSEKLGAEHTQIAYPGIALTNGFGLNTNKTGMSVQYFKSQSLAHTSSPEWDFSKYTPQIIVINLGQNDNSTNVPDNTFQSEYISFLTDIRMKCPEAEIFVMRTFTGVKAAPTIAAVNNRIAAGDVRLHYIDTNNWLTLNSTDYNDGVHPSVSGHNKAANLLASVLSPYLTGRNVPLPLTFDNCDAILAWASQNTLTTNTVDMKEGTGSLQSTGSGTIEFQKTFSPVISNASITNGALRFWYYISDVTKLDASNQIELGSGGAADINEYNWDIGPLVNGWNLITKTFASAGTTGGSPDLNSINWFRIYHAKTGSMTTRIDNIQILR